MWRLKGVRSNRQVLRDYATDWMCSKWWSNSGNFPYDRKLWDSWSKNKVRRFKKYAGIILEKIRDYEAIYEQRMVKDSMEIN